MSLQHSCKNYNFHNHIFTANTKNSEQQYCSICTTFVQISQNILHKKDRPFIGQPLYASF